MSSIPPSGAPMVTIYKKQASDTNTKSNSIAPAITTKANDAAVEKLSGDKGSEVDNLSRPNLEPKELREKITELTAIKEELMIYLLKTAMDLRKTSKELEEVKAAKAMQAADSNAAFVKAKEDQLQLIEKYQKLEQELIFEKGKRFSKL